MKKIVLAEAPPDEVARLVTTLRRSGPLAKVEPPSATRLLQQGTLLELAPGEVLIREGGAAGDEFYLLVEGSLGIQATIGTPARLDKIGDVVGEVAVLLKSRRNATVAAETTVRVVALNSGVLARAEYAGVLAAIKNAMVRDDWIQY